jgi:hypothetical protein
MENEVWKEIPFQPWDEFYEISNFGRVRSLDRHNMKTLANGVVCQFFNKGKILKKRLTQSGYVRVNFYHSEFGSKDMYIHRLVCMAFIGLPIDQTMQINHKNGLKDDNRLENLEWATPSQNIYHAHNNGLIKKRLGKDHNASKKVRQLSLDGEVIQEFDAINDIARLTKFDGNYIINALKGKRETAYGFKWQYV